MNTQILSIHDEQAIDRALEVLRSGGLVAFPTDTVYGVAAMMHDEAGIERLFEAKGREAGKAIAVLLGDTKQIDWVATGLTGNSYHLAQVFWPGALTLVVKRRSELPNNLSPTPTIGVRMPDHKFARALLRNAGPLATTSANLSGRANPLTAQDVLEQLGGRIELVLDGGKTPGGVPSTVIDCTVEPPAVLRLGAIREDDIREVLGGAGQIDRL
jgi:L-threonylcarbamoyladenylate synthase